MSHQLAFASGALDRAAHLRTGAGLHQAPGAESLVLWRGKLLVDTNGLPVRTPLDHPGLADARDAPLFLGLAADGPRFATDLALWAPIEDATTIGGFFDPSQQVHPGWPDAKFVEVRSILSSLSPLDGEMVATGRALAGWHGTHRFCANCATATEVAQAGWMRKCPQCATQHFPRTDPAVIMAITRGDRLLLGRAPSWPARMYSLLAGFVEPGEMIESAVRREVLEECGIAVGPVRYVASQPWPFPMSLMLGCHGEATTEDLTIDPVELADARWMDRTEVQAMLGGKHADIDGPRRGTIADAIMHAWIAGRLHDPSYWNL